MANERKATERELATLAENGAMAPNSRFDGREYRVVPESTGSTTTSTSTTSKKASTKKATRKAATTTQRGDTGVPGDNATTDAGEAGPVTTDAVAASVANADNASAARGPQ